MTCDLMEHRLGGLLDPSGTHKHHPTSANVVLRNRMPFEPRTARSARNWCRDELCVHHTPSLSCCNAGEHGHVHSSPGDAQLPRLSWVCRVCMWSLAQCPNMINMEHQQSHDWSGQTLLIIPGITVEHVCLESARRHSAIVMNCHREIGMFQAGSKMGRQDRTELVMFGMKACKFLRSTNVTNVNLEFKFAQWVTLVFHVFPLTETSDHWCILPLVLEERWPVLGKHWRSIY